MGHVEFLLGEAILDFYERTGVRITRLIATIDDEDGKRVATVEEDFLDYDEDEAAAA